MGVALTGCPWVSVWMMRGESGKYWGIRMLSVEGGSMPPAQNRVVLEFGKALSWLESESREWMQTPKGL